MSQGVREPDRGRDGCWTIVRAQVWGDNVSGAGAPRRRAGIGAPIWSHPRPPWDAWTVADADRPRSSAEIYDARVMKKRGALKFEGAAPHSVAAYLTPDRRDAVGERW